MEDSTPPKKASAAIGWAEMGLVPDSVIRAGIRRLCKQRLMDINAPDNEAYSAELNDFVDHMNDSPIALVPDLANEQHYEVPPEFFDLALGKHRKYSCCHWSAGTQDLDQAEVEALEITCSRAGIENGMKVLDLGCGWGSVSLWIARRFPDCQITSVSNSAPQKKHIERLAREKGVENIRVITCDMNDFDIDEKFDRVVSIEMFEHMRNYGELFSRINRWLAPGGKFFMHIFTHRDVTYAFEDNGPGDWMSRHFFSGGIMPSADLPLRFQKHLTLDRQWKWSGRHYEKTSNAWLELMDSNAGAVKALFEEVYGAENAQQWVQRWRIFFMACAELFGTRQGQEWFVSHYLFSGNPERA